MPNLSILSAGAAQFVVASQIEKLQREGHGPFSTTFGAVRTIKSMVLRGDHVDVLILTRELIDELAIAGLVDINSISDLGPVATGVAVRADTLPPVIDSADRLRRALLDATRIVCPDPEVATAGKVLLDVLRQLGILEPIQSRLVYCPSGYATLTYLRGGTGAGEIAVVQVTEILADKSVAMAGMLPLELQQVAIYAAAVGRGSTDPERAVDFIRRLTGQPAALLAAGFGVLPSGVA